ncbi:hypothetical protein EDC01DRAFT_783785 [Geopyxis carbonaria]|nr:hypothetical protein EDC01DRAFT_783785 [Geopyxis carbonaria]
MSDNSSNYVLACILSFENDKVKEEEIKAAELLVAEAAVIGRESQIAENIRCAIAVLQGRENAVLARDAAMTAVERALQGEQELLGTKRLTRLQKQQAVEAEWEAMEKEKSEWAAREVKEMETVAEIGRWSKHAEATKGEAVVEARAIIEAAHHRADELVFHGQDISASLILEADEDASKQRAEAAEEILQLRSDADEEITAKKAEIETILEKAKASARRPAKRQGELGRFGYADRRTLFKNATLNDEFTLAPGQSIALETTKALLATFMVLSVRPFLISLPSAPSQKSMDNHNSNTDPGMANCLASPKTPSPASPKTPSSANPQTPKTPNEWPLPTRMTPDRACKSFKEKQVAAALKAWADQPNWWTEQPDF